jgi:hypothetical protein
MLSKLKYVFLFCPQSIGRNHNLRLIINFQKCDKVQLASSDSNNQNYVYVRFGAISILEVGGTIQFRNFSSFLVLCRRIVKYTEL